MTMPNMQLASNDHDLIIQLHAKMDAQTEKLALLEDLEYRVRLNEDKGARHSEKLKGLETDMANSVNEIRDEIKALRSRDLLQSIALIMGTIVASVIAWFKH